MVSLDAAVAPPSYSLLRHLVELRRVTPGATFDASSDRTAHQATGLAHRAQSSADDLQTIICATLRPPRSPSGASTAAASSAATRSGACAPLIRAEHRPRAVVSSKGIVCACTRRAARVATASLSSERCTSGPPQRSHRAGTTPRESSRR